MLYAPLLLLVVGHPVPCTAGGEASAGKGSTLFQYTPAGVQSGGPPWVRNEGEVEESRDQRRRRRLKETGDLNTEAEGFGEHTLFIVLYIV